MLAKETTVITSAEVAHTTRITPRCRRPFTCAGANQSRQAPVAVSMRTPGCENHTRVAPDSAINPARLAVSGRETASYASDHNKTAMHTSVEYCLTTEPNAIKGAAAANNSIAATAPAPSSILIASLAKAASDISEQTNGNSRNA